MVRNPENSRYSQKAQLILETTETSEKKYFRHVASILEKEASPTSQEIFAVLVHFYPGVVTHDLLSEIRQEKDFSWKHQKSNIHTSVYRLRKIMEEHSLPLTIIPVFAGGYRLVLTDPKAISDSLFQS